MNVRRSGRNLSNSRVCHWLCQCGISANANCKLQKALAKPVAHFSEGTLQLFAENFGIKTEASRRLKFSALLAFSTFKRLSSAANLTGRNAGSRRSASQRFRQTRHPIASSLSSGVPPRLFPPLIFPTSKTHRSLDSGDKLWPDHPSFNACDKTP